MGNVGRGITGPNLFSTANVKAVRYVSGLGPPTVNPRISPLRAYLIFGVRMRAFLIGGLKIFSGIFVVLHLKPSFQ